MVHILDVLDALHPMFKLHAMVVGMLMLVLVLGMFVDETYTLHVYTACHGLLGVQGTMRPM